MYKTKTIVKKYDKYNHLIRIEEYTFRDLYEVNIDSEGIPHLVKTGVEETCEIKESDFYKF